MANCRTHRNGPWGGCVGDAKDVIGVPQRLESITIRSGWVIDSLEFSYIGEDGNRHTRGPWGGFAGNNVQKICLRPGEYLIEMSGTTGEYEDKVVVRSLEFVTNMCTYTFGRERNDGTPFSSRGTIVGFHGRCGEFLNSIGTYTLHERSQPTLNGPWGGCGGCPKNVTGVPQHLESITIRSGWTIDAIAFSYLDEAGQRRTAGPWGGFGGDEITICLRTGEYVREVSGTTGTYDGKVVVRSLKFVTNMCATYGPYGREIGTPFSSHGTVVGFHGRCGTYLDSIGTYTV